MFKPGIKLYIFLIIIVVILAILVIIFSSQKNQPPTTNPQSPTFPTPTINQVIPTKQSSPTFIAPTSTGGQEDIPKNIEDVATQKQNLRRKTPLQQNGFTITFDYSSDQFIVTFQSPTTNHQSLFKTWLQQNYPLIPSTEFIIK